MKRIWICLLHTTEVESFGKPQIGHMLSSVKNGSSELNNLQPLASVPMDVNLPIRRCRWSFQNNPRGYRPGRFLLQEALCIHPRRLLCRPQLLPIGGLLQILFERSNIFYYPLKHTNNYTDVHRYPSSISFI